MKWLVQILLFLPICTQAQAFGDRLLLGGNYGYMEDFVGDRNTLYERAHFVSARAGVSVVQHLYVGLQTRFIRAGNFETPPASFYMAGLFARGYFLHPVMRDARTRVGVFLETGFMLGNYAFKNRNGVEYYFEQPGSWYIPGMLGLEYRVWENLTLEAGLNAYYNNGQNWDEYGIGHLSLGVNWHW